MYFSYDYLIAPTISESDSAFVIMVKMLMWDMRIDRNEIAKALGLSRRQVSNLLNGRSMPSYRTLQMLKYKFNCDINKLLR